MSRLMAMSLFYSCSKPCSKGTHDETVKRLTLFSAFNRSNHDRTTALSLFICHSSETKYEKTTLSRHLMNTTWHKSEEGSSLYLVSARFVFQRYIYHAFKTNTNQRKASTTCRSNVVQNLVNNMIRIENSTAFFFAKPRNVIGTL